MRRVYALLAALIVLVSCSGAEEHGGFGHQPPPVAVAPSSGIVPIPHEEPEQAVAVSALPGFRFDPEALEIRSGRPAELAFTNEDTQEHTLVISELAVAILAAPGQTVTSTVAIDPKNEGEFVYFCSVSGHREAGMQGRITVR